MHRFEKLTILQGATGILTQATIIGQPTANKAIIICEAGSGHFRYDGGEPTEGMPFTIGTMIVLEGDDLQFFRALATTATTFDITYECPEEP